MVSAIVMFHGKVLLETSQNSLKKTCAVVSYLIGWRLADFEQVNVFWVLSEKL